MELTTTHNTGASMTRKEGQAEERLTTAQQTERTAMTREPLAHDIYDWSAGVSLLQLSFILDQLLPRRHIHRSATADARARIDAVLAEHYNSSPEMRPEPTGSFYEGLSRPPLMPLPWGGPSDAYFRSVLIADVDIMIVTLHKSVAEEAHVTADSVGVIETADTHKGYVRVRLLHPERSSYGIRLPGTKQSYLSSTAIMRDCEEGLLARDAQIISEILRCGPAITCNVPEKIKHNTVDLDSVIAIPCEQWPTEAADWLTRNRASGWPEEGLVQRVVAGGCHVVPTGHTESATPHIEWRYSFSLAERMLAQTLTDAQRHSYILFKTLVSHGLSHCSVLSSYHLKNIFLWQCEKVPASEWSTDTGLAATLLCLLDSLLHCVSTHCLPNYFIQDNNMLDHVHPDFLLDIAVVVSHLRHSPLKSVLTFNIHHRFMFSVVSFDLTDTHKDVIADAVKHHNNDRERYDKQWPALVATGLSQLREGKYEETIATYTQLSELMYRLGGEHNSVVSMVSYASLTLEVPHTLAALEYIRAAFPHDQHLYSVLGNLACMYHAAAFDDEDRREEMLHKAEETFLEAVACTGRNTAANKMDYAMFLIHLHRHNEAINLLKEVTAAEHSHPEAKNEYKKNETNTICDENLLKEIALNGQIATLTVAFAYYALAKTYCDTDRQTDAERLLPELVLLCNDTLVKIMTGASDHACAYSLLGYSFLLVHNYDDAKQAFGQAAQLKSNYTLAEENETLCEALKLSMLTVSDK